MLSHHGKSTLLWTALIFIHCIHSVLSYVSPILFLPSVRSYPPQPSVYFPGSSSARKWSRSMCIQRMRYSTNMKFDFALALPSFPIAARLLCISPTVVWPRQPVADTLVERPPSRNVLCTKVWQRLPIRMEGGIWFSGSQRSIQTRHERVSVTRAPAG